MKILAIEFSSETRSVALVEGEGSRVLGSASEKGGRHTRSFHLIESVLLEAHVEREAIECIAVGLGPGSYAGIRAAIALAQGWQLARPVSVLGISSMDCLAAQTGEIHRTVHFLIDAQRNEFYCGSTKPDSLHGIESIRLIPHHEARALPATQLYVELSLAPQFPGATVMVPEAVALGRLAATRSNFINADQLEPVYLRTTSFVKAPPPRSIPAPAAADGKKQ
jgi:tRNA threonylcarbamoyladenosine biosynthesis protein TsaB